MSVDGWRQPAVCRLDCAGYDFGRLVGPPQGDPDSLASSEVKAHPFPCLTTPGRKPTDSLEVTAPK
jgi:hypothetical protein